MNLKPGEIMIGGGMSDRNYEDLLDSLKFFNISRKVKIPMSTIENPDLVPPNVVSTKFTRPSSNTDDYHCVDSDFEDNMGFPHLTYRGPA